MEYKEKSWKYLEDKNFARKSNVAISYENDEVTYDEMFYNNRTFAKVCSLLNIGKDSRILVLSPNLPIVFSITYGANMVGAVVDYIDPMASQDKILKYIEQEKVTDIVALDLLYAQQIRPIVRKIKQDYGIKNIIVFKDELVTNEIKSHIKGFSKVLLYLSEIIKDKNVLFYDDLVRESIYSGINYDEYMSDKLSLITHTSGTTTGIGKPIPITDENRNALVYQHELAGLNFEPGMKMLHFIPRFAAYGSCNTAHLGTCMGMNLQQLSLFNPADFGRYLLKYKPNIVLANTPPWLNLMKDSNIKNADLSFLKVAVSGGTPTNPSDEIRFNEFLKSLNSECILTKGHGLSELCGCASYTTEKYNHIGGMGVPLPLTEYLIRNPATKEIIEFNGKEPIKGEALISSPNLTSGILDNKVVVNTETIDGKRYLPTKDIVLENEDGSLVFVERIDRMFPRADAYKVYPTRIEEMFNSLEEVNNSVVVSYFDEDLNGSMPIVYVALKEQYKNIDKEEFIRNVITEYFLTSREGALYEANFRDIPTKWEFVDEIPHNTMGKNSYTTLKERPLDGTEYSVVVNADNIKMYDFEVVCPSKGKGKALVKNGALVCLK